jgi:hypothetical protein
VLHVVVNSDVQKDKRKHTEEFVSLFEMDNNNKNIACTTLRNRWWTNHPRPKPVTTSAFSHVALLIDNHTTQCFWPKTRFAEAKIYWDGKNKIYGLKSEVAVNAHELHYYQFVGPHHVASAHDYQIHKQEYARYFSYLLKLPDETSIEKTKCVKKAKVRNTECILEVV